MAIKHRFVSSIPDVGGGTYIQPTHWNDTHSFPPIVAYRGYFGSHNGAISWSNQPSAITELTALAVVATSARFNYDFTNVTSVRVSAQLASGAFASAALGLQWTELEANVGSWWGIGSGGTNAAWCGLGSGFSASNIARGVKVGTWYPVNPSAVAAGWVNCRIVGFMGDGAVDPGFSNISVFVL